MPRPPRRPRRSRAQARFSAFFHGRSVITPSFAQQRKPVPTTPQIRTPIYDSYHTRAPRSRSPTSTRSLIDPSASPLSCAESLPSEAFPGFEGARGSEDRVYIRPSRVPEEEQLTAHRVECSRGRRAWHRPKKVEKEGRRLCFPGIKNPKIRQKFIGCLVSGSFLVIVLTICASSLLPCSPNFPQLTTPPENRPRPRNILPPFPRHTTLSHPPHSADSDPYNDFLPLFGPAVYARYPSEEKP